MKYRIRIILAALAMMAAVLSCNLPNRTSTGQGVGSEIPPTPTLDFSTVRLELSDLPEGFSQVSEAEMKQFGIELEPLLHGITSPLAKAEPENLSTFQNTSLVNSTFVVSFIVQPLTLLERGAFDILARNPQKAIDLFKSSTNGLTFSAQSGLEKIGSAVVGVTFSYDQSNVPIDGNLVISRRDQVVQVALEAHLQGGMPAVTALDVARIMDGKIQAALK